MFFCRAKTTTARPPTRPCPGRGRAAVPARRAAPRARRPARDRRGPRRPRGRRLRARLLLGRRGDLLAARRASGRRRSGTPAATPRTRRTRRSAPAAPGTPRPSGSSSTRRRCRYADLVKRVLRGPRPDAGHAPGQRRRHAVPLRDLLHHARAGGRPRASSPKIYGEELARRGFGEITTEIAPLRPTPYYYAEDHHQQYLAKNPHGYRCHANTGVPVPRDTHLVVVDRAVVSGRRRSWRR